VPAGHEQRHERKLGSRSLQQRREQVAFEVVHPDDRFAQRIAQCRAHAAADQQRSDQARACGHGDRIDVLARKGARVQAIIGPPNEAARIPSKAASVAQADIRETAAIRKLVAGADAVVHLAGPSSVAASFENPAHYVRVHTEGTAALLAACRAEGVRKLVYVSSAEVYGRPLHTPVDEDHPLSARSPYGAAKIGAEKMIEAFRDWDA